MQAAIFVGRNEVVTFTLYFAPMYNNFLSYALVSRLHFFFIYLQPAFLTPFLGGRSRKPDIAA
jgi:hypothetical protein